MLGRFPHIQEIFYGYVRVALRRGGRFNTRIFGGSKASRRRAIGFEALPGIPVVIYMAENKKSGFTLIELLVSMVIIALLAALLLPALSSARGKALTLNCQSNVHQLALTTFLYCQDNNDSLPFAWYDDSDPSQNNFFALFCPLLLHADFDGYSDFGSKVFTCPKRSMEQLNGPNPMRISYGMNAFNSVQFPDPQTKRLGQVQGSAATTLLVADIAAGHNHPPIDTFEGYQVGYKHDKRAVMIFFDGHAGKISQQETNGLVLNF